MSQTEIICACVIGVIALLGFIFLVCFVSYLEYKAKREYIYQLERIANASFEIVENIIFIRRKIESLCCAFSDVFLSINQGLAEICEELSVLSTISSDIDSIEICEHSFYDCTCKFYEHILEEIKKVGE